MLFCGKSWCVGGDDPLPGNSSFALTNGVEILVDETWRKGLGVCQSSVRWGVGTLLLVSSQQWSDVGEARPVYSSPKV